MSTILTTILNTLIRFGILCLEQSSATKKSTAENSGLYPCTPPPSPRPTPSPTLFKEDNLVHINVIIKSPRNATQSVSFVFSFLRPSI